MGLSLLKLGKSQSNWDELGQASPVVAPIWIQNSAILWTSQKTIDSPTFHDQHFSSLSSFFSS